MLSQVEVAWLGVEQITKCWFQNRAPANTNIMIKIGADHIVFVQNLAPASTDIIIKTGADHIVFVPEPCPYKYRYRD